ncbi:unnamed protein product [Prorocentrum cordatum]|uniref:Uncharacterized protein n=1 Tax=Prorocentrum cordatum TaxID=2364126 RepID=A0ABN9YCS8_9DINO|nr:unnamed protein product [Polarella glacialis]
MFQGLSAHAARAFQSQFLRSHLGLARSVRAARSDAKDQVCARGRRSCPFARSKDIVSSLILPWSDPKMGGDVQTRSGVGQPLHARRKSRALGQCWGSMRAALLRHQARKDSPPLEASPRAWPLHLACSGSEGIFDLRRLVPGGEKGGGREACASAALDDAKSMGLAIEVANSLPERIHSKLRSERGMAAFNEIGDKVGNTIRNIFAFDTSPAHKRSGQGQAAAASGGDGSQKRWAPTRASLETINVDTEKRLKAAEEAAKAANAAAQELEEKMKSSSASSASHGPGQRVPYEKRVIAKIGNLGWNDKPDVILARAREDRAEFRPARIVHRAFDMIEEMEAKMEPPLKLEKRFDGKYIKAEGNKRIGFVAGGQWHWSPWARARYPSDELDEAKQYADEALVGAVADVLPQWSVIFLSEVDGYRGRPWGSTVVMIGDWNADQLPDLAGDPFAGLPARDDHHAAERDRLQSLVDRFAMQIELPQEVVSVPGGPFAEQCILSPITRIPVGDQVLTTIPSCLDYAIAQPGAITKSIVCWRGAPADHAIVTFELACRGALQRGHKSSWKCLDEEACLQWLHSEAPGDFGSIDTFHKFLHEVQGRWQDTDTCRQRRHARLPFHIRCLHSQLAGSRDEHGRRALQREAWQHRKAWCSAWRRRDLAESVGRGKVFQKAKKLHRLKEVVLPAPAGQQRARTSDPATWGESLGSHFSVKWGAKKFQHRVNLLDAILPFEGSAAPISEEQLRKALSKIRRKCKLDHYGVSVAAILMVFRVRPEAVTRLLSTSLGSAPAMAQLEVMDSVLLLACQGWVDAALPEVPECFVGARPRTQCPDIAHGLQSVNEKGIDNFGRAAIAQADIERYYDSLPSLRIARWLGAHGVPVEMAACLLRHQMLPKVTLCAGAAEAIVTGPCEGCLTGNRVAGLFGRIPVESTMAERRLVWRAKGFQADDHVLCVCSYVDNLFSASGSLHGAISILDDIEAQLERNWGLHIKPSSRSCMAAAGTGPGELPSKWPRVHEFTALGHTLQDTGSIRACWQNARAAMWRGFWANPGSKRRIADEVDILQRRMVATIMRVPPRPGEEPACYFRKRGRAAAAECNKQGVWSRRWFWRVLDWQEHLDHPGRLVPFDPSFDFDELDITTPVDAVWDEPEAQSCATEELWVNVEEQDLFSSELLAHFVHDVVWGCGGPAGSDCDLPSAPACGCGTAATAPPGGRLVPFDPYFDFDELDITTPVDAVWDEPEAQSCATEELWVYGEEPDLFSSELLAHFVHDVVWGCGVPAGSDCDLPSAPACGCGTAATAPPGGRLVPFDPYYDFDELDLTTPVDAVWDEPEAQSCATEELSVYGEEQDLFISELLAHFVHDVVWGCGGPGGSHADLPGAPVDCGTAATAPPGGRLVSFDPYFDFGELDLTTPVDAVWEEPEAQSCATEELWVYGEEQDLCSSELLAHFVHDVVRGCGGPGGGDADLPGAPACGCGTAATAPPGWRFVPLDPYFDFDELDLTMPVDAVWEEPEAWSLATEELWVYGEEQDLFSSELLARFAQDVVWGCGGPGGSDADLPAAPVCGCGTAATAPPGGRFFLLDPYFDFDELDLTMPVDAVLEEPEAQSCATEELWLYSEEELLTHRRFVSLDPYFDFDELDLTTPVDACWEEPEAWSLATEELWVYGEEQDLFSSELLARFAQDVVWGCGGPGGSDADLPAAPVCGCGTAATAPPGGRFFLLDPYFDFDELDSTTPVDAILEESEAQSWWAEQCYPTSGHAGHQAGEGICDASLPVLVSASLLLLVVVVATVVVGRMLLQWREMALEAELQEIAARNAEVKLWQGRLHKGSRGAGSAVGSRHGGARSQEIVPGAAVPATAAVTATAAAPATATLTGEGRARRPAAEEARRAARHAPCRRSPLGRAASW